MISCSQTKFTTITQQQNNDIKIENISNFNFQYGKPISLNWQLDKQENQDFYVLNFVKREAVQKELSILIMKSNKKDVENQSFQNNAKSKFITVKQFYEEFISNQYGVKSFIFKAKSSIQGKIDNYIYSIFAYSKGFEYNITLSCYNKPIEEDEELKNILNSIKILE